MAIRPILPAAALALSGLLASSVQAQDLELVVFPLTAEPTAMVAGTLEFHSTAGAISGLMGKSEITMAQVPLPGQGKVTLDLVRAEFDTQSVGMHVNGAPSPYDSGDLSLWKGTVNGDATSEVFLGFSSYGTYGWIKNQGEFNHVLAFPAPGNDWANAGTRIVPDQVMQGLNVPVLPLCQADSLNGAVTQRPIDLESSSLGPVTMALGTTLECKIAVETDWQYYQNWNNLTAAQNYTLILLGAISDRYNSQIDTVLTYPYLMFYTSSNDPWTTQEMSGATAGNLLTEFRGAWQGNIPANANLAHFVSGDNLGGGVAYLDALCSSNWGFGVSAGVSGGTQFPVSQSSNTWDFVVIAHELGHNFGTSHTHNYCPPIDQCASSSYFGQCQNTRVCVSNGTIMSYCHTCGGGMNNITTFFHPLVVTTMRAAAVSSCLGPFTGGNTCLTDTFEPNDGCGSGSSIGAGSYTGMNACDEDSDFYQVSVAPDEQITMTLDFVDSNGNIECRLADANCFNTLDTGTSNTNDETVSWLNSTGSTVDVVLEVYINDGTATNPYDMDVIIVNTDPCTNIADDGLEENDSCAMPLVMGDGFTSNLFVSKSDADFYQVCVPAGGTLDADIFFSNANGDVDTYLYDPGTCGGGNGTGLAQGFSGTDDEILSWTNTSPNNRTLIFEVRVYASSASNCNTYDLSLSGADGNCGGADHVGTNFCTPAPLNSRGLSGGIFASGSSITSSNDLTLTAYNLPLNQFGYFLCSQDQGFVGNPAGSQGNLCLSTNIGRFASQVASSGFFGEIIVSIDLMDMPTNPHEPVLAGQTWNFQLWYRDINSNSNFTDGAEVIFQ